VRNHSHPITIQEAYFNWLYYLVYDPADPLIVFRTVCSVMHEIEFLALVPHDENRIADGAELRNRFQRESNKSLGPMEIADLMASNVSVFEVLLALADRADFMVPLTQKVWFRIFIENLKLDEFTDEYCDRNKTLWPVKSIINCFNNRAYSKTGKRGIFPLRRPRCDQREVELWYQMGAYMTENAMY